MVLRGSSCRRSDWYGSWVGAWVVGYDTAGVTGWGAGLLNIEGAKLGLGGSV